MKTIIILFMMLSFAGFFSACTKVDQKFKPLIAWYERWDRETSFVTVDEVPVARKIRFFNEEDNALAAGYQVRQIALIRHGEPDLEKEGRFNYEAAKEYIKNYDSVGIVVPDEPFFIIEEGEEVALFTSTLNRAKSTAHYLFGSDANFVESNEFREFERSLSNRYITRGLPLRYWTVSARIEWLLGINREGVESFTEAKKRALAGAEKLDEVSLTTPKVVLVAHGFLNRYLSQYLQDMGWEVVREGGRNYFATTILAKVEKEHERKEDEREDSIAESD